MWRNRKLLQHPIKLILILRFRLYALPVGGAFFRCCIPLQEIHVFDCLKNDIKMDLGHLR